MPTTLLYGGTFDPIHFGHLITAQSAAHLLHASLTVFIPANINPLKRPKSPPNPPCESGQSGESGQEKTPKNPSEDRARLGTLGCFRGEIGGKLGTFEVHLGAARGAPGARLWGGGGVERLEMVQLAISAMPNCVVEDVEIRRPPPSYTIDTVETLLPKYGPDMTLLIGADQLQHFHHWHRVQELLAKVQIAILGRPGADLDSGLELIRKHLGEPIFQQFRKSVLATPLIEISATDIRNRVKNGLSIDLLTPAPVAEYIRVHHLYVS